MAFWSSETLRLRLPTLVQDFDGDRIRHGAYELALGSEVILSPDGSRRSLRTGEQVVIPPGQFALLLTEEIIEVPPNALALISMRFGVKQKGLINVSGFHVDPGFRGRLKFAVYNAGVHMVPLSQGARTFLIWYSDLDQPTADTYSKPPQLGLTDDDALLFQGAFASPAELKIRLDDVERRLATYRTVGLWAMTSLVVPLVIALLAAVFRMVFPSSLGSETRSVVISQGSPDSSSHAPMRGSPDQQPHPKAPDTSSDLRAR